MAELDFEQIRPYSQGQREAFEEICCLIFRRAPEAPPDGVYRRIRGAGGDGGVEAIWRAPGGAVWGLQSKFFSSLDKSEKTQMERSLSQALTNYPELSRYTFCVPIRLTGSRPSRWWKFGRG